MERHEISPLQYLFFAVQRNTDLLPLFGRDKGITRDHAHGESLRHSGHLFANPSQTDDAEYLAVQLDTQQAALFPPARFGTSVGSGNMPRQRKQQCHGLFGDRNRTPSGCIDHQHAVTDRGI